MPVRATKLICTIGPASEGRIPELVDAGMDVARINLSHGTRDEHEARVRAVREASEGAGRAVAVLADLSGPKVRLREIEGGEALLERGARFALRASEARGDAAGAGTTHPGLADDLHPGDRVLLSDGAVELRVVGTSGDAVETEVVRGGLIRSRAGVNAPAERLRLPPITEKDERDLEWVLGAGIDWVAQSFVRRAEEVRALRDRLGGEGPSLMAKVETRSAVEDRDRILGAADAVMVARGDLGAEIPLERIPVVQKDLVSRANRAGVPVVVATEMLESMTESPRPTRAEAGDVAGAVFDGADAVLLSAETAVGRYPVEAARTAARILEVAETEGGPFLPEAAEEGADASEAHAVAHAAAAVVAGGEARAVACFTRTGRTARLLAAARVRAPVYAFAPDERVRRAAALLRGVTPLPADPPPDTDAMIAMMDEGLRGRGLAEPGDLVVMVASAPVGRAHTNLLKVHRVGDG